MGLVRKRSLNFYAICLAAVSVLFSRFCMYTFVHTWYTCYGL